MQENHQETDFKINFVKLEMTPKKPDPFVTPSSSFTNLNDLDDYYQSLEKSKISPPKINEFNKLIFKKKKNNIRLRENLLSEKLKEKLIERKEKLKKKILKSKIQKLKNLFNNQKNNFNTNSTFLKTSSSTSFPKRF